MSREHLLGFLAILVTSAAAAAEPPADAEPAALAECAAIEDEAERLACYDALSGRPAALQETYLDRHWDLYDREKTLRPLAHRPNYVLPVRITSDADETPSREGETPTADVEMEDLQSVEAKFQISSKTKLVDDLLSGPADLWFGYTQQSHFQVYNGDESRPFRETDYEPELMLTVPARQRWGSWTWRVVGAGFAHQSNGRSEPWSRSWNRLYALAAVEHGGVSIEFRPWLRVESGDDNNPDITDHVGRFEASLLWHAGRQVVSFRGRSNVDPGGHHGSLQADWFWPIREQLRGQVQVFSGYGESLIDYNHRQTTVGVGFLLFDPF